MAVSKTSLSSRMQSNIQAIPGVNITNATELAAFCDAVAQAVVDEMKLNGEILPGTFKDSTSATITGKGSFS